MPAIMHLTEPPADSMVGIGNETSLAVCCIAAFCSVVSALNAVCESAKIRPFVPCSSIALPQKLFICSFVILINFYGSY